MTAQQVQVKRREAQPTARQFLLICRHHPVAPTPHTRHILSFHHQKLTTLIGQYCSHLEQVNAQVNGNWLSPDELPDYRVQRGDRIILAPALADPVSAIWGMQILWTSLTVGAVVVSTAIGVGVSYGIAALTKKQNKARALPAPLPGRKTDYQWSEYTLQESRIPIALGFGTIPVTGNLIDGGTIITEAGDETRSVLISYGAGPWQGPVSDTLSVNTRAASQYAGISTEYRRGLCDQTACTAFGQSLGESWPDVAVTCDGGPVTVTTRYAECDLINLVIYYRARDINGNGSYVSRSLGIKIEISVKDADSWTTLADTTLSNDTDDTMKTVFASNGSYTGGSSVPIDFGTFYDLRITKTTADVDPESADAAWHLDEIQLHIVQEVQNTAYTHPGQVLRSVSAIASESISGSIQVREVWKSQICPIYDGAAWSIAFTRNPAWHAYFALTLPVITGDGDLASYAVDSYRGRAPSSIGNYSELLAQFVALAARCDELVSTAEGGTRARFTCDYLFAAGTNQRDALNKILNTCDAELKEYGNGFKLYIDQPHSGGSSALYCAGNIIRDTYQKTEISDLDKPANFEMDILNELTDYSPDPIPYYNEDAGNDDDIVQVSGIGFTHPTQSARKMYTLAKKGELGNWLLDFAVGIDGLNDELNDVITVADPWRGDGRIKAYPGGAVITLPQAPTTTGTDSVILSTFNAATGYAKVEIIAVSSVSGADVTLASTPTVAPKPWETVYVFCPTADTTRQWRIKTITTKKDKQHGMIHLLHCEEYHAGYWPSDSWDPVDSYEYSSAPYTSDATLPVTITNQKKLSPPPQFVPKYETALPINRTMAGNSVDTISWSATDASAPILYVLKGISNQIAAGSTTKKYIYWNDSAPTVYQTTDTASVASVAGNILVAVNDAGVVHIYDAYAQSAVTVYATAENYNSANDQNGDAITAPVIAADGTAVDHTLNSDGSADISLEWTWSGTDNDIDGWIVWYRYSASVLPYVFGTTPTEERADSFPVADKRAYILYAVPSNVRVTFGVQAYRKVSSTVAASGIITSAIVQPSLAAEDPYQPASSVAFTGAVTGTVSSLANHDADDLAESGTRKWAGETGADVTSDNTANNTSNVGTQSAATVQEAVVNFDGRNDRDASAITVPTIAADGTAVDHSVNDDGSADISLEWSWSGTEADIDGFRVYVRASTSATAYTMGSTPAEETLYTLSAGQRALIIYGVPINKYFTFGVQAYRVVDPDVNAAGIITTAIVQPALGAEDPYQPASSVAFTGNVTGTIDGTSASTVKTNAINGATFTATEAANLVLPMRADANLDSTHPLEIDWKVPANITSITSVGLSFKILPFRADATSDAQQAQLTSGEPGSGWFDKTDGPNTTNTGTGGTSETSGPSTSNTSTKTGLSTSNESPANPHDHDVDSHYHTLNNHTHDVDQDHYHSLNSHTHDIELSPHTHTIPAHTHGLVYGIYEEDNSPISVTYQVDNGTGYGSASSAYTTDQTDLDITSSITTTGWKGIRFNVDKRCRIVGIVEFKGAIT